MLSKDTIEHMKQHMAELKEQLSRNPDGIYSDHKKQMIKTYERLIEHYEAIQQ